MTLFVSIMQTTVAFAMQHTVLFCLAVVVFCALVEWSTRRAQERLRGLQRMVELGWTRDGDMWIPPRS